MSKNKKIPKTPKITNQNIFFYLERLNNFYPEYTFNELLDLIDYKDKSNEEVMDLIKNRIEEEKEKLKVFQPYKKYKLKENITIQDLKRLGFRDGGWTNNVPKPKMCLRTNLEDSIKLNIEINTDTFDFDFDNNIVILDDDFCQYYIPFYEDTDKVSKYCAKIRSKYNEKMDSLDIFEEI